MPHRYWLLWIAVALFLAACAPTAVRPTEVPAATPAPTDTPRPTRTATPSPTPSPSPTATATPWRVARAADAPVQVAMLLDTLEAEHPFGFRQVTAADDPDVLVAPAGAEAAAGLPVLAEQVLVPVVPFPTLVDDVAIADVRDFWAGGPDALVGLTGGRGAPTLYVVTPTLALLTGLFGAPPSPDARIAVVAREELVQRLWDARPLAWAIVPFDELEPRLKVLQVDGGSVLDKGLDVAAYPFTVRWAAQGTEPALAALAAALQGHAVGRNRDVARMTVLAMTGVTAPSRHMMAAMEAQGDPRWPAAEVGPLLSAADLTHLSSEVSFFDDCPPGAGQGGALCGKADYIELFKAVGADIIELTGNHMNDYGRARFVDTIGAYRAEGMVTFGGGLDLREAVSPTIVTADGNRVAFLGCNTVGPDGAWATVDGAGAAPCDDEAIAADMARLREQDLADVIIFTYQFLETQDGNYHYESTYPQRQYFHMQADHGADIVSGSQAHQPQGFSFTAGGRFISYGLGNLFFDQMFSLGTRQGLIERHVLYEGRYISTELITILNYDYGQPHVTVGDDRASLLRVLFENSDWP